VDAWVYELFLTNLDADVNACVILRPNKFDPL